MTPATVISTPEFQSYANHFLIAMPSLQSDIFEVGLIYLCEHSPDGAMGILVNRPTDIKIAELVEHSDSSKNDPLYKQLVYFGGPVHAERGFVLHTPTDQQYGSTIFNGSLCLTISRDILNDIVQGVGPEKSLICLGYAGWTAGQLEQELLNNAWLTVPATAALIFDYPPFDRYRLALAQLGIDRSELSSQVGHA